MVCEYTLQNKLIDTLAYFNGTGTTWEGYQGYPMLHVKNGDMCGSIPRILNIHFPCGLSVNTDKISVKEAGCQSDIFFPTSLTCPETKHELSGGWVFIIIVVCAAAAYIAIGCVYKAVILGTNGMESCPHIAYWQKLPGLVIDGIMYVFRCCTSQSATDPDYTTM
jgi:Mannose-6-phosphate receptor